MSPRTDFVSARINLVGLDRGQLEVFFAEQGERAFRARQVMQWVYQRGITTFEAMTDLSLDLRRMLAGAAEMTYPPVALEQKAADGTRKWVLQMDDDNAIETVFIPEEGRGTLCVSSQVGCALDCTFCATARQGFNRNLSAAEIIAQVWVAKQRLKAESGRDDRITNVVLMGMGEPLLNLKGVVPALRIMLDDFGFGLSKRRVTVSTSGVVPALDKLRAEIDVSLAVSLHAPNDALRNRLVPINRKYPITELMSACRRWLDDKTRKASITFEYVMLEGVNDADVQAAELGRLLRGLPAKINLIPFNPFPGTAYCRSSDERIARFQEIVRGLGITCTIRRTRGDDIAAACGQLVGQVTDRSRRPLHFMRLRQDLCEAAMH